MPSGRSSAALLLSLGLLLLPVPSYGQDYEEEPKEKPQFTKKEITELIDSSLATLNKGKDILRFASVKLPALVTDNERFRKIDRHIELCREETYPAVNAAEKLKKNPRLLRENMRLYMGMRLLALRCMILSDRLGDNANAAAMSAQIMDLSAKYTRLTLKLHPWVYKVINVYEAAAPQAKVESGLPLEGEESPAL